MKRSLEKSVEPLKKQLRIQAAFGIKSKDSTTCVLKFEKFGDILAYFDVQTNQKEKGKGCKKILGFDLDSTLIVTKSGNKFPKDHNDWKLAYPKKTMQEKLRKFVDDGFKLVVFSNQKGMLKGKPSPEEFGNKLERVFEELGSDLINIGFACIDDGFGRKPSTGMWDLFEREFNGGVGIDRDESLYCGDAAGRIDGWKTGMKKDFSDTDRKFALNLGIKFQTPEELFLGESPGKHEFHGFDPHSSLSYEKDIQTLSDYVFQNSNQKNEIVVLVGSPASGKSSFYSDVFSPKGYSHINQDTLKTVEKCQKHLENVLKEGKSAVIDNTNGSKKTRKLWIDIAKKHNIDIRCIWLQTPRNIADHLNTIRSLSQFGDQKPRVPGIAFNRFDSSFEPPTNDEGFSSVLEISFSPRFKSQEHKKLYCTYT
jgi:bifunctional polynucleotide phosphatase/kinase